MSDFNHDEKLGEVQKENQPPCKKLRKNQIFEYDLEHQYKSNSGKTEFKDEEVESVLWEAARRNFEGCKYNDLFWILKDVKKESKRWKERQLYYCPYNKHGCQYRMCRVKFYGNDSNMFFRPTISHQNHPKINEFDVMKFKAAAIQSQDDLESRPSHLLTKVALMGMPLSNEIHKRKVVKSLRYLRRKLTHQPGPRRSQGCLQQSTESVEKENVENSANEDTAYFLVGTILLDLKKSAT
mmetsp:Transcript_4746/g.6871  ORF Transcript_4746/g.6871 Transcript_4746/m.6871 type:complete len:239 (+) Transcript_4746:55-771(+)